MKKVIKILFLSLCLYFIVLSIGAGITLLCEINHPGSNIKNYCDSLWWALNSSSIGDSNVYPVTFGGRLVGLFLILFGYSLFLINTTAFGILIVLILDFILSIRKEKENEE